MVVILLRASSLYLDNSALILYEGIIRVKKSKLNFGHETGQKEGTFYTGEAG
jgi:hypothetical protein